MSNYNSKDLLKGVTKKPEIFYLIHYSCQSLFDDNEELSPRVTSIAVTHVSTEQTVSFSTHAVAEELGVAREEVVDNFDRIEKRLLSDFYNFVRDRRGSYWVHWNMRNLTFGFEHLEHRYRVLGGQDASVVPVEHRINLSDFLSSRYGSNYAPHPKQRSLMELNGGVHRHFLSGEEEVRAFQNGEFIRMHNSTLAKIGFMNLVLKRASSGKLVTASRGFGIMLDRIFEHRFMKAVGAFATILTIAVGGYQLYLWLG